MSVIHQFKLLLLMAIVVCSNYKVNGQTSQPKYILNFGTFLFADYGYLKPGISVELGLSRKVYKKIYARVWFHKSNSNYYAIPKSKFEGFTGNGSQDVYGGFFTGKPAYGFYGNKYDTYTKNAYLLNVAINKEIGSKKLTLIPELGISYGRAKEFNFYLIEITTNNDFITSAKSQASFARNQVFGKNLSLSLNYKIKNNFSLQFNTKLYLTNPKEIMVGNNGVRYEGDPYEGVSFGFTITKGFNSLKNKNK